MKNLYFYRVCTLLFLLALGTNAMAQNGSSISGTVFSAENRPLENAVIVLKGKGINTVTNATGKFELKGLAAGSYTLQAAVVGYNKQEKRINLAANEVVILNFALSSKGSDLNDVVITSGKINKLANRVSETVSRMPLKNLENPQVYTSISSELMKLQINTNFNDAIKNSSGIDKLWSSTGRAGDGGSYYTIRGFSSQASMMNGVASVANSDLDPSNIESIEVIKGPSGTLFGGALVNFGGVINVVTKKPIDTLGGEISYTMGRFNLNRVTADVYGPMNKDKNLLFRINTAYHNQNSFQDVGFNKSFFVAPSVEYRVSPRLKLNLDAQFYTGTKTNPLMIFLNRGRQLIARNPSELQFDYNKSYTSDDLTLKNPASTINAKIEYKLSDQWTSQTMISSSNRRTDGYSQYVMYLGASDTLITRTAAQQNALSTTLDIQQNFIGDFKLGNMRNRIVAGLDYLRIENGGTTSPSIAYDQINTSKANDPRYGGLSLGGLQAKIGASTQQYARSRSVSYVYSAYVSDVLNITDQLLAMASLRVDRFDNKGTINLNTGASSGDYGQTAVSPKLGLIYQVVKDRVSLFGNYMNGFKNVAPVLQPLPEYSGNLKPQHANQFEGGLKADILNHRLTFTASYYDINVTNVTRSITVTQNNAPYNITIQDGEQSSRGVEFDLVANPIDGLNIIAGYSHNDSKMQKSSPSVEGLRPVGAGPANMANFFVNYTIQSRGLKGLGFNFGGNYAGENIITNTAATGAFTLPSYTVLNAGVTYTSSAWRFGVKVDNLTDKLYFKGWTTVEPQMPRAFVANLSFRF